MTVLVVARDPISFAGGRLSICLVLLALFLEEKLVVESVNAVGFFFVNDVPLVEQVVPVFERDYLLLLRHLVFRNTVSDRGVLRHCIWGQRSVL